MGDFNASFKNLKNENGQRQGMASYKGSWLILNLGYGDYIVLVKTSLPQGDLIVY